MIGASLTVDGMIYKGWTALQAVGAIDAIAGEFAVSAEQAGDIMIYPGASAVLKLENQTVCSGYIGRTAANLSANDCGLTLGGADKTVDLAECSVMAEPDEWFNLTLCEIAIKLCAPFKIKVVNQVGDTGEAFKSFKIQPGESVFDALDRAAKARAVLATSDEAGNLVLTRAGLNGTAESLIYGENILEAAFSADWSNRFSDYTVKNQTSLIDDTQESANATGTSRDLNVKRYRPLLQVVQNAEAGVSVSDMAAWEACVRSGCCAGIDVTVQGWAQSDGVLWRKNTLSRVSIPRWGVDAKLLIKQVVFSLDKAGAKTKLTLVSPDAYKRLPVVQKSKDESGLLPPDAIEIK